MPSPAAIILHAIISLALVAAGIYVLIEKKMIVAGKFTGHLYDFESPANIIIAISLFMLAALFTLALIQTDFMRKVCRGLLISSLVLFGIGMFM